MRLRQNSGGTPNDTVKEVAAKFLTYSIYYRKLLYFVLFCHFENITLKLSLFVIIQLTKYFEYTILFTLYYYYGSNIIH